MLASAPGVAPVNGINIPEQECTALINGFWYHTKMNELSRFLSTKVGTLLCGIMCAVPVGTQLYAFLGQDGLAYYLSHQSWPGGFTALASQTGLTVVWVIPTLAVTHAVRKIIRPLEDMRKGARCDVSASHKSKVRCFILVTLICFVFAAVVFGTFCTVAVIKYGPIWWSWVGSLEMWCLWFPTNVLLAIIVTTWYGSLILAAFWFIDEVDHIEKHLHMDMDTSEWHDSVTTPALELLCKRTPSISATWGLSLATVFAAVVLYAFIQFLYVLPTLDRITFVGEATFVIFTLLLSLGLVVVPTMVTARCRRFLDELNYHALRHPSKSAMVQDLEHRLTGGYAIGASNKFGFTLFGVLITPTLLKTVAITISSAGSITITAIARELNSTHTA